jgi:hypothetical protein
MVDEKELDMIEQANLAAARIEKANAEYKELVKRSEQIESRRILGGQTAAGEAQPPMMTEEEKLKADVKNYFKGGIIEKVL